MRTTFTLRIRYQEDDSCSFDLTWGNNNHNVYVNQPYSHKMEQAYQSWRRSYLRYYKFQPSTLSSNLNTSGSIPDLSGDSSQDLRTVEQSLSNTFLDWLGKGKTQKIEQCIRNKLMHLMQTSLETKSEFASSNHHIDIYLFCDSKLNKTLIRLPWETWAASLAPQGATNQPIRLIRTTQDNPEGLQHTQIPWRSVKPRILAILGDDPKLPLTEDWQTLQSLKSIATVKRVSLKLEESSDALKERVQTEIKDDRGWDILFFAGHSHETTINGGSFELAPDVIFSMRDLTEHLDDARNQGLQLAVFNSCSGIDIGKSLAEQGIQAVVMREPIHNDVALTFLQQLCKHLKQYQNIHEATLAACQTLYDRRNNTPSAYLIPSFFSPVNVSPFQLKPVKWKARLQQWMPTKREAIAMGMALLLSSIPGVKDALLEIRVTAQSIYRDLTEQFKVIEQKPPPVHLIAVDQKSLDDANASEERVSQKFLADIIDKVSILEPKIIGVSYILNRKQDWEWQHLKNAVEKSAKNNETWFIFAISKKKSFEGFPELKNLEDGVRGDSDFYLWDVDLPDDSEYESLCPFNYLLALSHNLRQESPGSLKDLTKMINQKRIEKNISILGDENNFCTHVVNFPELLQEEKQAKTFIRNSHSFLGWQSIIDFSIPPELAYDRTPVWNLPQKINNSVQGSSSSKEPKQGQNNTMADQVIIIGPSSYEDAEEKFYVPLAIRYWWCWSRQQSSPQDCRARTRWFSGTEAQSYMTSQLLSERLVTVVPDYLLIGLAAILGKGLLIVLLDQPIVRRKRFLRFISMGTGLYGIACLQAYLSIGVVLPWLFPSVIFLSYFRTIYKR